MRYVFLFTGFMLGCGSAEQSPSGILSPHDFAQALVELSVIEAAQQQKALPAQYLQQPDAWTADALHRLNTDSAEFNRSFRFYYTHPEAMKKALKEADRIWNQR